MKNLAEVIPAGASRAVVPDRPNGRPDWFAIVRNLIYVLGIFVAVVFYFGQRLETPDQKSKRIVSVLAPHLVEFRQLKEGYSKHEVLGGHHRMEARMAVVESGVEEINKRLDRIIELLERRDGP